MARTWRRSARRSTPPKPPETRGRLYRPKTCSRENVKKCALQQLKTLKTELTHRVFAPSASNERMGSTCTSRSRRTAHLGTCACLVLIALALPAQTAVPVAQLDATRFTGAWYEIARYPNRQEKHCAADALLLVAVGDKQNQFQFVESCTVPLKLSGHGSGNHAPSGAQVVSQSYVDSHNNSARSGPPGVFKVRTLWPFSRQYQVLALGPVGAAQDPAAVSPNAESAGYAWSLLGTPNRKELWIYARTPTLAAATLAEIEASAAAQGFDPKKLVMTMQTAR